MYSALYVCMSHGSTKHNTAHLSRQCYLLVCGATELVQACLQLYLLVLLYFIHSMIKTIYFGISNKFI